MFPGGTRTVRCVHQEETETLQTNHIIFLQKLDTGDQIWIKRGLGNDPEGGGGEK